MSEIHSLKEITSTVSVILFSCKWNKTYTPWLGKGWGEKKRRLWEKQLWISGEQRGVEPAWNDTVCLDSHEKSVNLQGHKLTPGVSYSGFALHIFTEGGGGVELLLERTYVSLYSSELPASLQIKRDESLSAAAVISNVLPSKSVLCKHSGA